MAQDHFKTPPDQKMAHENPKNVSKKRDSRHGGGRGPNMCLGPLRRIYIYTSAAPCISMHVVILILMLQQSQMQGVQRLHL